MKWTPILVIAAVVVIFLLVKQAGQISAKDVREYLKQGAMVIDVRSSGEYRSGHLPKAINIPLDQIEASLPQQVKDKNQVLLLHCQSGMRSAAAAKKMKELGYSKACNLGSLSRARALVGDAGGE